MLSSVLFNKIVYKCHKYGCEVSWYPQRHPLADKTRKLIWNREINGHIGATVLLVSLCHVTIHIDQPLVGWYHVRLYGAVPLDRSLWKQSIIREL